MYLVISEKAEPGTLDTLPKTEGLTIIKEDELINSDIFFTDEDTVAITTESVLDVVNQKTTSKNKLRATQILKDKVLFREVISNMFEDYMFLSVTIDELPNINITKKMIIKPRKGFFGTAIRIIDEHSDLQKISTDIKAELTKNKKVFSDSILSTEDLLVEDFISGEEYAVDMFYDKNGKPQILNIYYHPKPKHEEYIHMLYCSSKETHEALESKIIDFYTKLNETLQVKNYPIHGEFKLDNDTLIPIEMNPLRFGGMGLGNMSFYTMNVNPYEYLSKGKTPDWKSIWNNPEHKNAVYNFLIAYNGKSIDVKSEKPNIDKLKNELGKVLNETHFDYQKGLVFGIFTSKETKESIENLKKIDFDNFFERI